MARKHLVICDTQVKSGIPLDYIEWISAYIVDKKPDVLVIIGDWADMPSLSSYDVGTKSFEGRKYRDDILAANDALQRLMAPIEAEIAIQEKNHKTRWNLRKIVTLGNHEHRIDRAIEKDRKLEGLISTKDIFFEQWGFEVYPFKKVVVVDGVAYSHYFSSGSRGNACASARQQLMRVHMSCFAGHKQGKEISYDKRGDGKSITSIISGSSYVHEENYLGPQDNIHWRGIFVLNEVNDGAFDEMPVSMRFLQERYKKNAR